MGRHAAAAARHGTSPASPGLIDPHQAGQAAAEIGTVLAGWGARAGRVLARRARRITLRWVAWWGLFTAWPAGDLIRIAPGIAGTFAGAAVFGAPFGAMLITVHRRERAAWVARKGKMARGNNGEPVDTRSGRADDLETRLADCEAKLASVTAEVTTVRDGVAAAWTAAGLPPPRPRLSVVAPPGKRAHG